MKIVPEVGKSFQQIRDEIGRWREILAVPYQEYMVLEVEPLKV
jgi:hypothetical protein